MRRCLMTCSECSPLYIIEVLNAASLQQALTQTQEVTPMKTLLISFVFGDSKRNGIIMGVRHDLPNKVKHSKDFPGTYYKEVTDDHGQRKIYRYVPLDQVARFVDATQTEHKVLEKVLTEEELNVVTAPESGEVWEDEQGTRYLFTAAGFFVTAQGDAVWLEDIDSDIEYVGQGLIELDTD